MCNSKVKIVVVVVVIIIIIIIIIITNNFSKGQEISRESFL